MAATGAGGNSNSNPPVDFNSYYNTHRDRETPEAEQDNSYGKLLTFAVRGKNLSYSSKKSNGPHIRPTTSYK